MLLTFNKVVSRGRLTLNNTLTHIRHIDCHRIAYSTLTLSTSRDARTQRRVNSNCVHTYTPPTIHTRRGIHVMTQHFAYSLRLRPQMRNDTHRAASQPPTPRTPTPTPRLNARRHGFTSRLNPHPCRQSHEKFPSSVRTTTSNPSLLCIPMPPPTPPTSTPTNPLSNNDRQVGRSSREGVCFCTDNHIQAPA